MSVLSFDTETYYDANYSVEDLGADRYAADPRFDCYMISVCDGEETWVGHPSDFNWGALVGRGGTIDDPLLVSHNAAFDQAVYRRLMQDKVNPFCKDCYDDWHCTSDLAAYVCNERSLAKAVEVLYGVQLSKAVRGAQKGKRHTRESIRHPDETMKRLLKYARDDAYWCWKIWTDHSHKWPRVERELSVLTRKCADRGVQVDADLLNRYIALTHDALMKKEAQLPWTAAGHPPTSPRAFAEHCRLCGIPVPAPKSDDADAWIEWESEYGPRYPWIGSVSDWRSINKVYATLNTIKLRLRPDNTIAAPLKYFGSHTGRWSGDSGLNFQNFRKDPLVVGDTDVDIRRLFRARPGKKLIIADLAQIEPRVLWSLAGDRKSLELVSQGISPYEAHARTSPDLNWTGGKLKSENKDLYALCKARVLGLGYGCGWRKFITLAKGYGVELTEESSRAAVESFRKNSPLIGALWKKLDQMLWHACRDNLEVVLPNGRELVYHRVRRTRRSVKKDDGKIVNESAFQGWVGKRPYYLYGGMLTENLVQAVARDVFAEGLLRLDKAGYTILFTCHDEVVIEADSETPTTEIGTLFAASPSWLKNCPVEAEVIESEYYKK